VVKPNATADVTLTLVAGVPASPTNYKRIVGIGLLGTGAAFLIAGGVSSILALGNQHDFDNDPAVAQFKATLPKTTQIDDICPFASAAHGGNARVASYCDKGSTLQVMQFAFYGASIAAVGAGVFLVGTSGTSKPKTGLKLDPKVSSTSGKLDLVY